MSKKKPGRNDPCHCGSGKPYKTCSREKDRAEQSAADRTRELARRDETELAYREVQQLDAASNAVLDLIDAGRLDKAEQAARKLLEDYPEVPDGHERLAMVYEARGERAKAAEHYRACLQQVQAEPPGSFDPGFVQFLNEKIQALTVGQASPQTGLPGGRQGRDLSPRRQEQRQRRWPRAAHCAVNPFAAAAPAAA